MYSNLFDPQSIQDLMAALPTIPVRDLGDVLCHRAEHGRCRLCWACRWRVLLVVGEKNGVLPAAHVAAACA